MVTSGSILAISGILSLESEVAGLGFRGLGFRGLGLRGLGLRGFRGLGFRGLGFMVFPHKYWVDMGPCAGIKNINE